MLIFIENCFFMVKECIKYIFIGTFDNQYIDYDISYNQYVYDHRYDTYDTYEDDDNENSCFCTSCYFRREMYKFWNYRLRKFYIDDD